jgi:hypothetical protein
MSIVSQYPLPPLEYFQNLSDNEDSPLPDPPAPPSILEEGGDYEVFGEIFHGAVRSAFIELNA